VIVERSRSSGWGRVFRGNRIVWVLAGTAVGALAIGTGFGAVLVGAEDAGSASRPTEAGLITVPVERRVISNEIVTRGDALFADAVELSVDVSGLDGPAVVTGEVPAVGSTLEAGTVALEIAGRPVIVLPGEVPAYRTMRVGASGSDITQLKAALVALGIDPGDAASPLFDQATASAVAALYSRVGYDPPQSDEGADSATVAAEGAVRQADLAVLSAHAELVTVRSGASASERAEQDAGVSAAERAVATAREMGTSAEVADAEDALAVARIRRDEVLAPASDAVAAASLEAARADAASARRSLVDAREDALTVLPASEVAFVPALPRRVDAVTAVRGQVVQGSPITASGATLTVNASLANADASLVRIGGGAVITLADGTEIPGTIASIAAADELGTAEDAAQETAATSSGTRLVAIVPAGTAEQLVALQGQNVRVALPVESTDGEVLAVPLAALSAASDGSSRVEIPTGSGLETELVPVEPGLAAEGFVEVTVAGASLEPGDQVVVGR
jgi:hypothetical protein